MCPAGVFAVCGVVAYAAVEDADQSVAQCAQGLMVHVSGSVVVMCSGAAAATWVNMARETSKWLFECDPQVSPRASHTWAKRTEPFIVQKCGSARGMSTAHDRMVCQSSRQSVAIIFVAVGSPVARLNSEITWTPGVAPLIALTKEPLMQPPGGSCLVRSSAQLAVTVVPCRPVSPDLRSASCR